MPPNKRTRMARTNFRRLVYALFGIGAVLAIGTIGFELIAGLSAVNAVYFESMLATGQGPPLTLTTDSAKIFASIMAFVSVGSVVSTLLFAVGPVVRMYWREAAERFEEEARELEREVKRAL